MKRIYKSKASEEKSTKGFIETIKKSLPAKCKIDHDVKFIKTVGLGKPARNTSKT